MCYTKVIFIFEISTLDINFLFFVLLFRYQKTMEAGTDYLKKEQRPIGTKRLSKIFNTMALLPWKVAEAALREREKGNSDWKEEILKHYDVNDSGYRFSINEDVAEQRNLALKMVVQRIIRQQVQAGKNEDGTPKFRNRIVGIECYWWIDKDGNPVMM